MRIAIIGGGASGLMVANYLSRNNSKIDITIYERNKGLGRKILASGNGKCNFMNYKALPSDYNHPQFIKELYEVVSKDECLNYFNDLGLLFKFDNEGRMYPMTESSQTILSLLTADLKGVKVLLESSVLSVEYKNNKVVINGQDSYDYVVLASGSNASISLKNTAQTYNYLKPLNLNMVTTSPVLVGLKVKEKLNKLKNLRMKCHLSYFGTEKYEEDGEVIFKDDGLSGICVMNSSRYFKPNSKLILDFYKSVSEEELEYKINQRYKSNNPDYYLEGVCHPKMIEYLKDKKILLPKDVAAALKAFTLDVLDTYEMENAQVSRGGISIDELNSNLTLKKYPRVFAGGELLDIDGRCGGYNLMFAFMCGMAIGKELLAYENKTK